MSSSSPRRGYLAGVAAYVIWGLFPLFWNVFKVLPTYELLAQRIAWCAIAVWLYLVLKGEGAWWRGLTRSALARLALSSVLISLNWAVYIGAVNSGHVIDTSLGYFITPLANVLFGVVLLRERLNILQGLAVFVAFAGVAWLVVVMGTLPGIALVLALTFGSYGLVRKLTPVDPVQGLAVESTLAMLPSLAYLAWSTSQDAGAFQILSPMLGAMLVIGGAVTAIPLVLFAFAARNIPLTMLGILQYIPPTVGLLLGLYVFHEPFGPDRWVAFTLIWIALAIFSVDALWRYRHSVVRRD
ncbi:MAG: EamA family transporter RarD [Pseudomonadota bacterium]|jgi:chloramphenicol-sensitive protein RarD